MANVGTPERPLKVAIIGAGPSGFYAAAALLGNKEHTVRVDVLDRLPTPFGLVRGGVAPDHQNIKAVIRAYDKTAKLPGFRFFGHVTLGADATMDDLLRSYDQVVVATGCESANPLGIPGEDLPGSYSATEFVGWYNGHPDHRDRTFDLSHRNAVVVGVGNVSMDVTRILIRSRQELATTDIAEHALEALRASKVDDVYVLGRRGSAQAAYSPGEIKEIAELEGVDMVVRPEDSNLDPASLAWVETEGDKQTRENVRFLQEVTGATSMNPRRVHLRLNTSPIRILGEGKVEAIELGTNRIEPDGKGGFRAVDTGEREILKTGLVFRAIGYRGKALPGVPFDERKGTIPNEGGRVTRGGVTSQGSGASPHGAEGSGAVVDRLYVVGWAKRGPQGLIGTNRADSKDTVDRMVEDLSKLEPSPRPELGALATATTWSDWEKVDLHEVSQGKDRGKIREKLVRVADMLSVLGR